MNTSGLKFYRYLDAFDCPLTGHPPEFEVQNTHDCRARLSIATHIRSRLRLPPMADKRFIVVYRGVERTHPLTVEATEVIQEGSCWKITGSIRNALGKSLLWKGFGE